MNYELIKIQLNYIYIEPVPIELSLGAPGRSQSLNLLVNTCSPRLVKPPTLVTRLAG